MADHSPPSSSSWSRHPSASYSGAIPPSAGSSNSRAPSPQARSNSSSAPVGPLPGYPHSHPPTSASASTTAFTSTLSSTSTGAAFAGGSASASTASTAATSSSRTGPPMASAALVSLLPPGENFLLPYNPDSHTGYQSTLGPASGSSSYHSTLQSGFGQSAGTSVASGMAASYSHSAPSLGGHNAAPRSAYYTGPTGQRYPSSLSVHNSLPPNSSYSRLPSKAEGRLPSAHRPSESPEQNRTDGGEVDQLDTDNDGSTSFARSNERFMQSFYDPHQVKHRRRTTPAQLEILDAQFQECSKPDMETRKNLAKQLDMTIREVQVWFQNRRAKQKKIESRGPAATGRVRSEGSDSSGSGYPYPTTFTSDRYSSYTTNEAPAYPQLPSFNRPFGQTGPSSIDARMGSSVPSGSMSYYPPSIRTPSGHTHSGLSTRPSSSSTGSTGSYGHAGSSYSLPSDDFGPSGYGSYMQQSGLLRPPMSSMSGSSGSSRSSSNDDYLSTGGRRGALPPGLSKLSISPTMGTQPSSGTPFAPSSAPSSVNSSSLPFSSSSTGTSASAPFMSEGSRSGATFPAALSYATLSGDSSARRQSFHLSGSATAGGMAGFRDTAYNTSPVSNTFAGSSAHLNTQPSGSLQTLLSRDQSGAGLGLGTPSSSSHLSNSSVGYPSEHLSSRRSSIAPGFNDVYGGSGGRDSMSSFQDGMPLAAGARQPSGAAGYPSQQQQSGFTRRSASGSYLGTVLEHQQPGLGSLTMSSEGDMQSAYFPSGLGGNGDQSGSTSPDASERGLSSAEGTPGGNRGLGLSNRVKSPPNLHALSRSVSRSGSNSGLLNQYEGL